VEFRQLRYFIGVAETLSFTKAGQRLHIAQPALSRQIRQLEDEIGVALFLRNRRKVELTDAGLVFLREARTVVEQAHHAVQVTHLAQRGAYGIVRIGLASGLASKMSPALSEHGRRFPEVELQCHDILSSLQNEALRDRKIDVGFLRPPVDDTHMKSERLFEEQFLVYLSRSSPLTGRTTLRLKDVAHLPLLLYERSVSTGVYDKTLDLYEKAGIVPTIIHTGMAAYEEAGTVPVASGKGIFIGVGAVKGHPVLGSGIAAVPLDEPNAKIEVRMAWRRNETSPAVLAFLQSVRRMFKAGGRRRLAARRVS
jgi:DNA-binding transcriptional LysR family regulator